MLSIAPRVFNINFENKTGQGSKEYKHVCEAMRERERERVVSLYESVVS